MQLKAVYCAILATTFACAAGEQPESPFFPVKHVRTLRQMDQESVLKKLLLKPVTKGTDPKKD